MQTMTLGEIRADAPLGRTAPVRADIEMDVVVMLGVAVGGQHDREVTAGPARKMTQEQALGPALAPIVLDADGRAVGQPKAGDVDRPAQGVLAEVTAAVDRAAGKAAEVVDPYDPMSELGSGEGLHHLALEFVEPACQRAAHDGRLVQSGLHAADPHGGIDLAARTRRTDRRERAVMHLLGVEPGKTGGPAKPGGARGSAPGE